jgi:hypothetical protein
MDWKRGSKTRNRNSSTGRTTDCTVYIELSRNIGASAVRTRVRHFQVVTLIVTS